MATMQERLEKERLRRVAKAEAKMGVKDGATFLLESPSGAHLVQVSVQFYPKEHWIVQDFDIHKGVIQSSGRALTPEIKAQLKPWL